MGPFQPKAQGRGPGGARACSPGAKRQRRGDPGSGQTFFPAPEGRQQAWRARDASAPLGRGRIGGLLPGVAAPPALCPRATFLSLFEAPSATTGFAGFVKRNRSTIPYGATASSQPERK